VSGPIGPPDLIAPQIPEPAPKGGRRLLSMALTCLILLLLVCSGGCYACYSVIKGRIKADLEEIQQETDARIAAIETRVNSLQKSPDADTAAEIEALRTDLMAEIRELREAVGVSEPADGDSAEAEPEPEA